MLPLDGGDVTCLSIHASDQISGLGCDVQELNSPGHAIQQYTQTYKQTMARFGCGRRWTGFRSKTQPGVPSITTDHLTSSVVSREEEKVLQHCDRGMVSFCECEAGFTRQRSRLKPTKYLIRCAFRLDSDSVFGS